MMSNVMGISFLFFIFLYGRTNVRTSYNSIIMNRPVSFQGTVGNVSQKNYKPLNFFYKHKKSPLVLLMSYFTCFSSDDNIAINLGTEVYFINSKGWLIKQYIANQEVKKVIVSDRLAAIIFKDKIEILIL